MRSFILSAAQLVGGSGAVGFIRLSDSGENPIAQLPVFEQSQGEYQVQSYYVAGENLTSDLEIVVPQGYEISLGEDLWVGFPESITVPKEVANAQRTRVFVRVLNSV